MTNAFSIARFAGVYAGREDGLEITSRGATGAISGVAGHSLAKAEDREVRGPVDHRFGMRTSFLSGGDFGGPRQTVTFMELKLWS